MASRHAPRIEIDQLTQDTIRFTLSNTDTSVANALRRVILAEVPTMAIEVVELEVNDTVLHDEFIAHRLGLVPLVSHKVDQFQFTRDCSCDGVSECSQCSVIFDLHVRCEAAHMEVTSNDLKSRNPDVVPVTVFDESDGSLVGQGRSGVVIVRLTRGQELKLRAIAHKGVGKDHAKWSPVSCCTYQFYPEIEINRHAMDALTPAQREDWTKSCPTRVYAFDPAQQRVTVESEMNCMYCNECVEKAESLNAPNLVRVHMRDDRFQFTVESTGALYPQDILRMALALLKDKLKDLRNHLASNTSSGM